jgi:predicted nuclease of predicted toxin-antitoxin system
LKFFLDEDLPRSLAGQFREAGYEAVDIRDTPLRGAKDPRIALYVQEQRYCLVSGDFGFADIRNYPPQKFSGIVVVHAGKDATSVAIKALLAQFLQEDALIRDLAGKLAIVEPGRIRLRAK